MTNIFHETTWKKVQVDDTVLMPWVTNYGDNKIVKIQIDQCSFRQGIDRKMRMSVIFIFDGRLHHGMFDQDQTVYVQSRF